MPRGKRKAEAQSAQQGKLRILMTRILLFQPKPTTTDDDLEALFKAVHAMQPHIPCLIAVTAGENHSHQHKGWTHGIVFYFEDEQHLQGAMEHKAYQSMLAKLTGLSEASILFDIPQQLPLIQEQVVSVPPPAPARRVETLPPAIPFRRWQRAQLVSRVDPRLVSLTVEQLGVDEDQVTPSAGLVEDLNADSLGLVEYIFAIEEAFHIQISDEDAMQLDTMSEIQTYLLEREVL